MKIATIINYCTNDYRFINKCIEQAKKFSNQIIIPISSHYFNGELENKELLTKTYQENPSITFVEYEWTTGQTSRYWHNMSRIVGTSVLDADIEWVLFLDADEIVDTDLMSIMLSGDMMDNYDSLELACYWYFREPTNQSTRLEQQSILVRKNLISIIPNSDWEREQLRVGRYSGNIMVENRPIIHHYSWVRTKDEMLKKVKTWGHNKDKDWSSLVEQEFTHQFNGTDFIHGYQYKRVENKFNL